jgi:hypothetical protein
MHLLQTAVLGSTEFFNLLSRCLYVSVVQIMFGFDSSQLGFITLDGTSSREPHGWSHLL